MHRKAGLAIVGGVCFVVGSATVWAMTQAEADEAWSELAGAGMLGASAWMFRQEATEE